MRQQVLKVPVWEDIRQLIVSPRGDLIAVLTSHTVHVAVLPDPSHLRASNASPIKLKAYTVGSTTHVLTRAPLASAVWHPLGVSGHCLVTTTTEAIVRVWEFDLGNRWSFDSPTLTINLRRLADGLPQDQDLSSSRMSASKVFSPDAVEMEVAAACFGGPPRPGQDPWASMTLWIAMRQGDVYALCPLLPSKWCSPRSLVSSLSATIVSNHASSKMDSSTSDVQRRVYDEQMGWIREVENQQYMPERREQEDTPELAIYKRSDKLEAVPALQGPFDVDLPTEDDDNEDGPCLTDIYTIAARSPDGGFTLEESQLAGETTETEGLSWGMICLLTSAGRIHVLLDAEGVEGRWPSQTLVSPSRWCEKLQHSLTKPQRSSQSSMSSDSDNVPWLLHFESLDLDKPGSQSQSITNWPLFTPSLHSAYLVFVTHGQEVTQLSFTSLEEALEQELRGNTDSGLELRLDVIANSASTAARRIIKSGKTNGSLTTHGLSASVIFPTSDSEYLLVTAGDEGPVSVVLDMPRLASSGGLADSPGAGTTAIDHLRRNEWPPYEPSREFFREEPLRPLLVSRQKSADPQWLTKEVEYSQDTVLLLGSMHSAVSQHRQHVSTAATDLFQHCNRMLSEFQDQVRNLKDIRSRVDRLLSEDRQEDDQGKQGEQGKQKGEEGIQRRIEKAKSRHQGLVRRLDALQRKEAILGTSVISIKEEAWMAELRKLASSIVSDEEEKDDDESETTEHETTIQDRYHEVRSSLTLIQLDGGLTVPQRADQAFGRGTIAGSRARIQARASSRHNTRQGPFGDSPEEGGTGHADVGSRVRLLSSFADHQRKHF